MKDKSALFVFAVVMALVAFALRVLDYHYLIHDIGLEVYLGIVGCLFLGFGLWVGGRFLQNRATLTAATPERAQANSASLGNGSALGLTIRELEILQLIAAGHSNQEIADRLFISLNTVKTHSSNLFLKLDVKRRTQAVLKAKEMNLLT